MVNKYKLAPTDEGINYLVHATDTRSRKPLTVYEGAEASSPSSNNKCFFEIDGAPANTKFYFRRASNGHLQLMKKTGANAPERVLSNEDGHYLISGGPDLIVHKAALRALAPDNAKLNKTTDVGEDPIENEIGDSELLAVLPRTADSKKPETVVEGATVRGGGGKIRDGVPFKRVIAGHPDKTYVIVGDELFYLDPTSGWTRVNTGTEPGQREHASVNIQLNAPPFDQQNRGEKTQGAVLVRDHDGVLKFPQVGSNDTSIEQDVLELPKSRTDKKTFVVRGAPEIQATPPADPTPATADTTYRISEVSAGADNKIAVTINGKPKYYQIEYLSNPEGATDAERYTTLQTSDTDGLLSVGGDAEARGNADERLNVASVKRMLAYASTHKTINTSVATDGVEFKPALTIDTNGKIIVPDGGVKLLHNGQPLDWRVDAGGGIAGQRQNYQQEICDDTGVTIANITVTPPNDAIANLDPVGAGEKVITIHKPGQAAKYLKVKVEPADKLGALNTDSLSKFVAKLDEKANDPTADNRKLDAGKVETKAIKPSRANAHLFDGGPVVKIHNNGGLVREDGLPLELGTPFILQHGDVPDHVQAKCELRVVERTIPGTGGPGQSPQKENVLKLVRLEPKKPAVEIDLNKGRPGRDGTADQSYSTTQRNGITHFFKDADDRPVALVMTRDQMRLLAGYKERRLDGTVTHEAGEQRGFSGILQSDYMGQSSLVMAKKLAEKAATLDNIQNTTLDASFTKEDAEAFAYTCEEACKGSETSKINFLRQFIQGVIDNQTNVPLENKEALLKEALKKIFEVRKADGSLFFAPELFDRVVDKQTMRDFINDQSREAFLRNVAQLEQFQNTSLHRDTLDVNKIKRGGQAVHARLLKDAQTALGANLSQDPVRLAEEFSTRFISADTLIRDNTGRDAGVFTDSSYEEKRKDLANIVVSILAEYNGEITQDVCKAVLEKLAENPIFAEILKDERRENIKENFVTIVCDTMLARDPKQNKGDKLAQESALYAMSAVLGDGIAVAGMTEKYKSTSKEIVEKRNKVITNCNGAGVTEESIGAARDLIMRTQGYKRRLLISEILNHGDGLNALNRIIENDIAENFDTPPVVKSTAFIEKLAKTPEGRRFLRNNNRIKDVIFDTDLTAKNIREVQRLRQLLVKSGVIPNKEGLAFDVAVGQRIAYWHRIQSHVDTDAPEQSHNHLSNVTKEEARGGLIIRAVDQCFVDDNTDGPRQSVEIKDRLWSIIDKLTDGADLSDATNALDLKYMLRDLNKVLNKDERLASLSEQDRTDLLDLVKDRIEEISKGDDAELKKFTANLDSLVSTIKKYQEPTSANDNIQVDQGLVNQIYGMFGIGEAFEPDQLLAVFQDNDIDKLSRAFNAAIKGEEFQGDRRTQTKFTQSSVVRIFEKLLNEVVQDDTIETSELNAIEKFYQFCISQGPQSDLYKGAMDFKAACLRGQASVVQKAVVSHGVFERTPEQFRLGKLASDFVEKGFIGKSEKETQAIDKCLSEIFANFNDIPNGADRVFGFDHLKKLLDNLDDLDKQPILAAKILEHAINSEKLNENQIRRLINEVDFIRDALKAESTVDILKGDDEYESITIQEYLKSAVKGNPLLGTIESSIPSKEKIESLKRAYDLLLNVHTTGDLEQAVRLIVQDCSTVEEVNARLNALAIGSENYGFAGGPHPFFENPQKVRDLLIASTKVGMSARNKIFGSDIAQKNMHLSVEADLYQAAIVDGFDGKIKEGKDKYWFGSGAILYKNRQYVKPDTKAGGLLTEQLKNLGQDGDMEYVEKEHHALTHLDFEAQKQAIAILNEGWEYIDSGRKDSKFKAAKVLPDQDGDQFGRVGTAAVPDHESPTLGGFQENDNVNEFHRLQAIYQQNIDQLFERNEMWLFYDSGQKTADSPDKYAQRKKRAYIRDHKPQVLAALLHEKEKFIFNGIDTNDPVAVKAARIKMARHVFAMATSVAMNRDQKGHLTPEEFKAFMSQDIVKEYANERVEIDGKQHTLISALQHISEYKDNAKESRAGKYWSSKHHSTPKSPWDRPAYVRKVAACADAGIEVLAGKLTGIAGQIVEKFEEAKEREPHRLNGKLLAEVLANRGGGTFSGEDLVATIKFIGRENFTATDISEVLYRAIDENWLSEDLLGALLNNFEGHVTSSLNKKLQGRTQTPLEIINAKASDDPKYAAILKRIKEGAKTPEGKQISLKDELRVVDDVDTYAQEVENNPKAKALKSILEQALKESGNDPAEAAKLVAQRVKESGGALSGIEGIKTSEIESLLSGFVRKQIDIDELSLLAVDALSVNTAGVELKEVGGAGALEKVAQARSRSIDARLAKLVKEWKEDGIEPSDEQLVRLAQEMSTSVPILAKILNDLKEAQHQGTDELLDAVKEKVEQVAKDQVSQDIQTVITAIIGGADEKQLASIFTNLNEETKQEIEKAADIIKQGKVGEVENKFLDNELMKQLFDFIGDEQRDALIKAIIGGDAEFEAPTLKEHQKQRLNVQKKDGSVRVRRDSQNNDEAPVTVVTNGISYIIDPESMWLASYVCDQENPANGGHFRPEVLAIGFNLFRDVERKLSARVAGGEQPTNGQSPDEYWARQRMAVMREMCTEYGVPELAEEMPEDVVNNPEKLRKFIDNLGADWPADKRAVAMSILYAMDFNNKHQGFCKEPAANRERPFREQLKATMAASRGPVYDALLLADDDVDIDIYNYGRFKTSVAETRGVRDDDDREEAHLKRYLASMGTTHYSRAYFDNVQQEKLKELRERQRTAGKPRGPADPKGKVEDLKGAGPEEARGGTKELDAKGEAENKNVPGSAEQMGGADGTEKPTVEQWADLFKSANARHADLIKTYTAKMSDMTTAYMADKREQSGGGIIQNLSIGGSAAILAACLVPPNPIGLAFAGTYLLMNSGAITNALRQIPILGWLVNAISPGEASPEDRAREALEPLLKEVQNAAAQAKRFEERLMRTSEPQSRSYDEEPLTPFFESNLFLDDIKNALIFPPSELRRGDGSYEAKSLSGRDIPEGQDSVPRGHVRFGLIQQNGTIKTYDIPKEVTDCGSKGWLTRDGSRVRLREVDGEQIVERKTVGGKWSTNLGPYTGMVMQGILPVNAEYIQDAVIPNRKSYFRTSRVDNVPQDPQFDEAKIQEDFGKGNGSGRVRGKSGVNAGPDYDTIMETNRFGGPSGNGLTQDDLRALQDMARHGTKQQQVLAHATKSQHGEKFGHSALPPATNLQNGSSRG